MMLVTYGIVSEIALHTLKGVFQIHICCRRFPDPVGPTTTAKVLKFTLNLSGSTFNPFNASKKLMVVRIIIRVNLGLLPASVVFPAPNSYF